jgi:hypothetical protein
MRDKTKSALPPHLQMFPVSFAFFATGAVCFFAALLLAVRRLPPLIQTHALQSPGGIFLTHLLLLGWATPVAMGAGYQITQVLLRSAVFSRKLALTHLILYAAGVAVLLSGFACWAPIAIACGGALAASGVAAFVVNLAATYIRARQWTPVAVGAMLSLIGLCAAVALGAAMGIAMATGRPPAHAELLFATHLWLGLGGWLAGLIVSYSLKLLPMFYVSKKKASRSNYTIVVLFQAAVWLGAAGGWLHAPRVADAGRAALVVALAMLAWFAYDVRRQSSGKQPVGAVQIAAALVGVTCALAAVWAAIAAWPNTAAAAPVYTVVTTLVVYLVFGLFSATILAYLSKIVPFLWWAFRFRTKEQKKGAVLLADMAPQRRLTVELWGYLLGVTVLLAGTMSASCALAAAGLAVMAVAAGVYLVELARVLRY